MSYELIAKIGVKTYNSRVKIIGEMKMLIDELENWFNEQDEWFIVGTNLLIANSKLSDEMIDEIVKVCLSQTEKKTNITSLNSIIKENKEHNLHLTSIGNINGVYALAPKKQLDFKDQNMSIIYGSNGSGKSSYVRLLKNICNSRTKEKIFGNIYKEKNPEPTANINYIYDGVTKDDVKWSEFNNITDLSFIDVFDSKYGDLFIKNSNTVTYEPPIFSFFTDLISMVKSVQERITVQKNNYISKLPKMPLDFQNTTGFKWFNSISEKTTLDTIDKETLFSNDDNSKLLGIQERLGLQDPSVKIKELENQIRYLEEIKNEINSLKEKISNTSYKQIISLAKACNDKKEISKTASEKVFSESKLDGFGEETWKTLWQAARSYSEEYVYKEKKFPFVEENARCVLCHQILNTEAKQRLTSFESYVKGYAEQEYQHSLNDYNLYIENLPIIDNIDSWKAKITAGGINDEVTQNLLINKIKEFKSKKEILISKKDFGEDIDITEIQGILQKQIAECKSKKETYEEDKKAENRDGLKRELLELSAKKWLNENKESINPEVDRKKSIYQLDDILKKLNTRFLTLKKAELSETLITEEFIERFNNELRLLNVHVNVEFRKEKAEVGKIKHSIVLKNSKTLKRPDEILSEGEYRIVSIAAFFADVLGRTGNIPFIFDDPISSLDSDYEDAVAKRLISLSKNRQIIIFTHRISFMTLLHNDIKEGDVSCNTICIKSEPWSKGEPEEIPLNIKKSISGLKIIRDQKIPGLQKIFTSEGSDSYELHAKAMCSNIRILIERFLEEEVLSGVVMRFRRSIQTMGRLNMIAYVSKDDCRIFDELMTKYSCFEHSQSNELTINLPTPDDFKRDVNAILDWKVQFDKRVKESTQGDSN